MLKKIILAGALLGSSLAMTTTANAALFKGFGGICNSTIHQGRLISGYFYQNYEDFNSWVSVVLEFSDTEGNSIYYNNRHRVLKEGYTVPRRMLNTGFVFYDMRWEASNGVVGEAIAAVSNCSKNPYNTGDVFTGQYVVPALGN